jgi:hypothetical protein
MSSQVFQTITQCSGHHRSVRYGCRCCPVLPPINLLDRIEIKDTCRWWYILIALYQQDTYIYIYLDTDNLIPYLEIYVFIRVLFLVCFNINVFIIWNCSQIKIWLVIYFKFFLHVKVKKNSTVRPQALVSSQKYARYVPKIPQGQTHSYYPRHFNRYFPCQNVDRTQIAY